jgi:alkylation response protein AidB-like acyl-CoA dehydrogenase
MTTNSDLMELVGTSKAWESYLDPEVSGESSTLPALERLGRAGLLDLGITDTNGLVVQFEVLSSLAEQSLSIAFSAWAHRMVVEYVSVDRSSSFRSGLARRLSTAELIGSTAMAPALRAQLGLGSVGLTARRDEQGLVVDGTLAWASNLYPGRVVIVAAVELDNGEHAVVALTPDIGGVDFAPPRSLLAMDATQSSSVVITGAHVPLDQVLSWDLPAFLADVRPVFLFLQTAFCLGLAAGSIRESRRVELAAPIDALEEDLTRVIEDQTRIRREAVDTFKAIEVSIAWLIGLRLEAATVAQRAVAIESRIAGGRGYLAGSGVSRRYREAAFLPVQSPTEAHLRWELSCFG